MDGIVIIVSLAIVWFGARWLRRVIPKLQNRFDQHFPLDYLTEDILEYVRMKGSASSEEILRHLGELGYGFRVTWWELEAKLEVLQCYDWIELEDFHQWRLLICGYEALERNAMILRKIAIETGLAPAPQEYPSPEELMD